MKRFAVPGLSLVVAASLAAAACQPAAPATPATPGAGTTPAATTPAAGTPAAATTPVPKPTGPQTLTVGISNVGNVADLLNPTFPMGHWKFPMSQQLTELVEGGVGGQLAESFRAVSPTSWEFRLKESRFSDGTPLTAEDVKFSIERALVPENNYAVLRTTLPTLASAEVVDPRTIRLNTTTPDPVLPNRLTVFPIISKTLFEQQGADRYNNFPIASGQYKLDRYQPRQEVVLVANPNYVGPQPNITRITFKEVPEASARLAAISTGEVDIIDLVPATQIPQLTSNRARPVLGIPGGINTGTMDTREPQFRPTQVRQAMNLAVNKQQINETVYAGQGVLPSQPVTQGSPGFVAELQPIGYDPARARQLLAEGGFPNGFSTPFVFNPAGAGNNDLAQIIAQQLGQVGIRVDLQPADPATFLQRILQGQAGPFYLSQFAQGSVGDPAGWLNLYLSEAAGGPGRYNNPEFDRLYQQQVGELDGTRRNQILQQIMRLLANDPPGLYLPASRSIWGARDIVGNFDGTRRSSVPPWDQMTRQN